jgi:hypothetical protein
MASLNGLYSGLLQLSIVVYKTPISSILKTIYSGLKKISSVSQKILFNVARTLKAKEQKPITM